MRVEIEKELAAGGSKVPLGLYAGNMEDFADGLDVAGGGGGLGTHYSTHALLHHPTYCRVESGQRRMAMEI
jgi:hypothetical protein